LLGSDLGSDLQGVNIHHKPNQDAPTPIFGQPKLAYAGDRKYKSILEALETGTPLPSSESSKSSKPSKSLGKKAIDKSKKAIGTTKSILDKVNPMTPKKDKVQNPPETLGTPMSPAWTPDSKALNGLRKTAFLTRTAKAQEAANKEAIEHEKAEEEE
jgi:hypothetical protein